MEKMMKRMLIEMGVLFFIINCKCKKAGSYP